MTETRPTGSTASDPEPKGGRPSESRPGRDSYLDNAKGLLIVLVVIGHSIELAHGTRAEALYVMIYSFHMPAFVFITGYLTRGFTASVKGYLKIVTNLLVPYAIFQVLHRICSTILEGEDFTLSLLQPEWTLWFLLATAWWRAFTPLLMKLPHRLPIAVAVSLGAGFLPELTSTLALNRTLTLLPFFVLGLSIKPRHLELIKKHFTRVSGLITFGVLGVLALGIQGAVPNDTFFYNASFHELDGDIGQGILYRLATMATGVVGTCAVLAIVPVQKTWWTYLGKFSMYVYVLHALVIHVLRAFDLASWPSSWIDVSLVALAAVLLSLVLASRPVRVVMKPVVQPPIQKLVELVPDDKDKQGTAKQDQDTAQSKAADKPDADDPNADKQDSAAQETRESAEQDRTTRDRPTQDRPTT
ncbi:MAG TPA: acyltransferase family protein [Candidatus Avipropionibacterium avicola]|uniref:Acyltransferase family protein n=1 Tax=Candidatus Avipropionibacterium avicola TaxID=2840701 RepID=A0A9D1H011_9ACTN|nr:acyltransferase family protein [Candidatus Avipropionibacterium avicola]